MSNAIFNLSDNHFSKEVDSLLFKNGFDGLTPFQKAGHTKWAMRFSSIADACESPIERLFLAGLFNLSSSYRFPMVFIHPDEIDGSPKAPYSGAAFCYPQVNFSGYRFDFLILDATDGATDDRLRGIVVECDGHDFHDRTKDQARRDKSRDREIQYAGFRVLRFTGSEIWENPRRCAMETGIHLSCIGRRLGHGGPAYHLERNGEGQ